MSKNQDGRISGGNRWNLIAATAVTLFAFTTTSALRAETDVSTATELQAAIDENAITGGSLNIVLTSNIVVTTPIYIGTTVSPSIGINGAGFSITGSSQIFFIQSGNISLLNLTLTGAAQGGNGGNGQLGGGGAAGLGGAIFIGSTADVSLNSVQFTNNSATGGTGGSGNTSGFSGGGGLNGGNGGSGPNGGGGGNGGAGGTGSSGGGGGGGLQSPGFNGTSTGGNGGGPNGGAGGNFFGNGGAATGPNSGGGGAGFDGQTGGAGSVNGGGGGGGGNGGEYGGGGGSNNNPVGGTGGFGGGGGASGNAGAGVGGFGGGGGSDGSGGAAGGVGGGSGGTAGGTNRAGGGGGAALGGAIFIQAGGMLAINGSSTFTGGTLTAGAGGAANPGVAGTNGAAAGTDLFLMTGTTTVLGLGAGSTQTFNGTIADDSAASLPSGGSYTPGTAAGAALFIGNSHVNSGTVILNGANTYSGGTMLENGTLVLGNSQALGFGPLTTVGNTVVYANGVTISNPIVMTGDTALEVDNADSATQSGVISESGASHSVTKTGTGTLILTNTNTYSGGTTINSGTLEVDGSAGSGTITISGSELLATTGIANNITLNAGTTNTIATPNGSTETFSGLISGGDVTIGDGTNTGAVYFTNGSNNYGNTNVSAGSTIVVGAAPGATPFGTGTVTLNNNTTLVYDTLVVGGNTLGNAVDFNGNVSINTLVNGAGGSVTLSGQATLLSNTTITEVGISAIFLNNVGQANPGTTLTLAGDDLRLLGSDSVSDTIVSGGTILLSNSNAHATILNTLDIENTGTVYEFNPNQFGPASTLIIEAGGTFKIDSSEQLNDLEGTGTISSTMSFTPFGTSIALSVNSGNFAGTIADGPGIFRPSSIRLTKTSSGTLVLSGPNTYTGGTAINAGILEAQNNSALGSGAVTVSSGATLTLSTGITVANNITISGTGTTGQGAIYAVTGTSFDVTETVAGTVTLAANASVGADNLESNLTLGAVNLQSFTLTTSGTGRVNLQGNITGAGGLTIGSQVFVVGGQNSFTGLTDVLSGADLMLDDSSGIAISGDLTIEDGAAVFDDVGGQLAHTTTVTLNGSGELNLNGGGPETIAGLQGTSGTSLVTMQSIMPSSTPTALTLAGTGTYAYAGQITDSLSSPLSLVKEGSGTQILSGANTYSGGTTLAGGILQAGSATALGTGTISFTGGTLQYGVGVSQDFSSQFSTTAAQLYSIDTNGQNVEFDSALTSAGGSLTKLGAGTLNLTNANTYSGGTTISSGILEESNNSALGTGDVTVASGASLELNGGTNLSNNITISGTGVGGAGAIFTSNNFFEVINLTGTVSLAANASITDSSSELLHDLHELSLSGTVNLGAYDLTVEETGGEGGLRRIYLNGQVTGVGGGITVETGTFLAMAGTTPNTYTGLTTVQAGAVLALENSGGTAVSGDLTIAGLVGDFAPGQLARTTVLTLTGSGELNLQDSNETETFAGLAGPSPSTQVTPVEYGGNDTLALVGTGTYVYAGLITDNQDAMGSEASMTVVKQGSGSQEFDDANSYSGGTTLTAGTLIAGNASAFGTGPLQVNGGTLTMGNGNHTISVNNYAQTAGTLYLTVTGSGQAATADQLHVTNTLGSPATLGGNLTVNLAGFTVPTNARGATYTFTLVATDAGYNGSFVFDPLGLGLGHGLTATLDYLTTPDDVLLQIMQAATSFSFAGLTPNQQAVASNLNQSSGSSAPNISKIITALQNLPLTSLPGAFDALSPQAFGQFTSATAFNNASFDTEAHDNYTASQRGGPNGTFVGGNGGIDASGLTLNDPSYDPTLALVHSRLLAWNPAPTAGMLSDTANPVLGGVEMKDGKDMKSMAAPAYANPWNFYVRGNVVLAQGFSDPDVSHFDDNTESVVLGTDYRLTKNFLVGITAGYGHTDVTLDNSGSSATVDSYSPGLYASYADMGWYANASGNYIHNAYTQSRVIGFLGQTATSAPEGNEGVANLDGGYDFHRGALTFGPLAGLQYTHLTVDGYNESGSDADLSVNSQDADSLRSRVGGRVTFAFAQCGVNFTPHLDASWQHEFLDQSRGITSQFNGGVGSFSVRTTNPSRESALIDAGLDAEINRTVTVFGDYVVQAGQDNYFGQSVQAGVKIGF